MGVWEDRPKDRQACAETGWWCEICDNTVQRCLCKNPSAAVQKTNDLSAQPCGCDQKAGWVCDAHKRTSTRGSFTTFYIPPPGWDGTGHYGGQLTGIADSGKRITYDSGSMRDPSEGKIKWSRITFGPMMRRWAQHLTTAEAKYPDPSPGYPNFMLIETEEELIRYKESAFRHFMSWFNDETDEDHASAVFFNINGVEIIKDKQRR